MKKYWKEFFTALGEFVLLTLKIIVVLYVTCVAIGFTSWVGNTQKSFTNYYSSTDK